MDSTLSILQYNCGNANYKTARPLLDAISPATHMVLVIQEPAYNERMNTTYCPVGYNLAYEASAETKICFIVSKQIYTSK
jgi:hypothetical protein